MAYRATRTPETVEELQLVDELGNVVETLKVNLNCDFLAQMLSEKYTDLIKAQQEAARIRMELKENRVPEGQLIDAFETLGNATISIIQAVFGKDASKVLDFYENRTVEMAQNILPFITGVVVPKVRAMTNDHKQEIIKTYKKKIFKMR